MVPKWVPMRAQNGSKKHSKKDIKNSMKKSGQKRVACAKRGARRWAKGTSKSGYFVRISGSSPQDPPQEAQGTQNAAKMDPTWSQNK